MKHKILILCLSFLSICGVAFAGGSSTTVKGSVTTWGTVTANSPPNFYGSGRKCGLVAVTRERNTSAGFVQATKTIFFCGPSSSPCTCRSAAFLALPKVNIVSYCLQFGNCP